MPSRLGLVTGSQPFAGLPTNPAELVLAALDGLEVEGFRVHTLSTPVSFGALPEHLPALIAEHRPAFVLALGLALGAPVIRAETVGLNTAHFAMSDNEGARPVGGIRFALDGPEARRATWDAAAVVDAIMDAGIPARLSFHAGTHLCNLTLYTYLGALELAGLAVPCGFLHLPYTPEQVVWLMQNRIGGGNQAPGLNFDLPSMPLTTQVTAVRAAITAVARQARRQSLPHD